MNTKHAPNYFRALQETERVSGPYSLTAEEMGALRAFERAAPDLLEALVAALKHFRHPTSAEAETRGLIVAAIAKATEKVA